jgi:hypothetical protein
MASRGLLRKPLQECRECELFEDCEDKVSTDETADWYIKGKYKCYYETVTTHIKKEETFLDIRVIELYN